MYIHHFISDKKAIFRLYQSKEAVTENGWENVITENIHIGHDDLQFDNKKLINILIQLLKTSNILVKYEWNSRNNLLTIVDKNGKETGAAIGWVNNKFNEPLLDIVYIVDVFNKLLSGI